MQVIEDLTGRIIRQGSFVILGENLEAALEVCLKRGTILGPIKFDHENRIHVEKFNYNGAEINRNIYLPKNSFSLAVVKGKLINQENPFLSGVPIEIEQSIYERLDKMDMGEVTSFEISMSDDNTVPDKINRYELYLDNFRYQALKASYEAHYEGSIRSLYMLSGKKVEL